MADHPRRTSLWRPPTRRAFVAMISAAAASLAVMRREGMRTDREQPDEARSHSSHTGATRWIGHC